MWLASLCVFWVAGTAVSMAGDPPLAHYKDSLVDSSGAGRDAVAMGYIGLVPGLEGDALDFDGESHGAELLFDLTPDKAGSMTWSAWIRPESTDGRRQILCTDDGGFDRSLLVEDGYLAVFCGDGCRRVAPLEPGKWQHVAAVFVGGEISIYLNSERVAQVPEHVPAGGTTYGSPRLGGSPTFGEHFHGLMDEVIFFPHALTDDGIKALYRDHAEAAQSANANANADRGAAVEVAAESAPPSPAQEAGNTTEVAVESPGEASVARDAAGEVRPVPAGGVADQSMGDADAPDLTFRAGGPLSRELSLLLLGNDVPAVSAVLLAERWDNPIAATPVDFALPRTKDESGKEWPGVRLSDFRGSPVLLLFYSESDQNPHSKKSPDSDQAKAVELLAKISETPAAAQLGLKCVIVTPYDAAAIKKDFESRGIRVRVINDPTDEVRRQMRFYSLPMVLLDKNGAMVWHNRVGQRGKRPPDADGLFRFDSGDLNLALKALSSGAIKYEKSTPMMRRPKPAVAELFTFEDALSGWHLAGDAWGAEGVASEKIYPGLVKGYEGTRWLSSFPGKGIDGTGLAVSPEFVITKRYLHFTVGGGDLRQNTGVALVCNGTTLQLASGENTFEMKPVVWDLGNRLGQKARLIVYDTGRHEQRDGIMVDGFTWSESSQKPEAFNALHDPNNPDHARRVAKDLPEDWRELQAGNFRIDARPGKTFRLERMYQVQPVTERPLRFNYEFEGFPDTVAQTIHQQTMEVRDSKKGFASVQQPTGKAVADKALVAEVRPSVREEKTFPVRHHMLATANILTIEKGRPADFQPLPEETALALTKARGDVASHPDFQDAVAREGLERWSDETEPAYLLRCWRWLQRYWTDAEIWGGWPVPNINALPVAQEWEHKSLSCPAVGAITLLMRNAGIPAIDGQGFWANDNGNISPPHVRSLVFLDKIGWVHLDDHKFLGASLGPFSFGSNWGDNYFQAVHDQSPRYEARGRPETTQPGEHDGETWWRSWRGQPPDNKPL